jgi:carbon storage regulator
MLVLSRKVGQEIIIGDSIRITYLGMRSGEVRLGIEAPADVKITRKELLEESNPNATRTPCKSR